MGPILILLAIPGIASLPNIGAAAEVPPVVEVAPMPHVPAPPITLVAVKGGYQFTLNREVAEQFADALNQANEKEIAASLRKYAKDRRDGAKNRDDQTAATLEMIAFVVSSQVPGFKKSLNENMGPNGVVITLTGLQSSTIKFAKPRPRLERVLGFVRGAMPLLPDDMKQAVEALRAVGRTTPLFWKVEPRK